ncbi:MAG: CsgG/HfaB family protein [Spirochaetales bacterium]|jgi:hypothetical protein|nr:CsgG/HfaB family protein [Spirochaetales bacterium]
MKKMAVLLCATFFAVSGIYAQRAENGQSEIIVKRAKSTINAGFREQIYIDGSQKLTLVNGTEAKIIVLDGEHTISAKLSTLSSGEVRFTARSGSLTFSVTPAAQQLLIKQDGGGSLNSPAVTMNQNDGVEGSLERAAGKIMEKIPKASRIAIVYVSASDPDVAEFIANELEFIMVENDQTLIDRSQLDAIRKEQNFQLSGEVDDDSAVFIGKISGANIIITGAVTGSGSLRRLRLRAMDTQSAQVLSAASERY